MKLFNQIIYSSNHLESQSNLWESFDGSAFHSTRQNHPKESPLLHKSLTHGLVRWNHNPRVGGSSPSSAAKSSIVRSSYKVSVTFT